MIKLLLKTLLKFIDGGHKKIRDSTKENTVIIYEVKNKEGVVFTRIDIFTML